MQDLTKNNDVGQGNVNGEEATDGHFVDVGHDTVVCLNLNGKFFSIRIMFLLPGMISSILFSSHYKLSQKRMDGICC